MKILTCLVIAALGVSKLSGHLEWGWLAVTLVPAFAFWVIDGTAHTAFHAIEFGDRGFRLIQAWRAFFIDSVLGTLLVKFVIEEAWGTALVCAGLFSALVVSVGHVATAYFQAERQINRQVSFWFSVSNLLGFVIGWCIAEFAFGLGWWARLLAAASTAISLPTLVATLLVFAKRRMDRAERLSQLRRVGFAK